MWADSVPARYQATPPSSRASVKRSATESKNEPRGEAVPEVGRIDIACDWDWRPVCAIETVEVRVMPFEAMDEDMVPDQGEFADLADWRRGYRAYLERSVGFRPGIEMVVERFRVVEVFA